LNEPGKSIETAAQSASKRKILQIPLAIVLGLLCFAIVFVIFYRNAPFYTLDDLKQDPFFIIFFREPLPLGGTIPFFLLGTLLLCPAAVVVWLSYLFLLVFMMVFERNASAWFLLIPLICSLGLWYFGHLKNLWKHYFRMGIYMAFFSFVLFIIFPYSAMSSDHGTFVPNLRELKATVSMYAADHGSDLSRLSENDNHILWLVPYTKAIARYPGFQVWISFDYARSYAFYVKDGVGWVGRTLEDRTYFAVVEEMEQSAESDNLLGSPSIDTPPVSDDVRYRYTRKARAVWMRAY
jgi:hypothetical protein